MLFVITGAPGAGKTRLAAAVLDAALERGRPTLLLHTDILKVLLRDLDEATFRGPGYVDFEPKLVAARPFLEAQADKARRDGYDLIIEGTLAAGFAPEGARYLLLELAPDERARRAEAKHHRARQGLAHNADAATAYAEALPGLAPPGAIVLDAALPLEVLVERVLVG